MTPRPMSPKKRLRTLRVYWMAYRRCDELPICEVCGALADVLLMATGNRDRPNYRPGECFGALVSRCRACADVSLGRHPAYWLVADFSHDFEPGDRVKFDPSHPASEKCGHGIVVYHKGRHSKKMPRVRWDSGWGTSHLASELRHLTAQEFVELPTPEVVPCDGLGTPMPVWPDVRLLGSFGVRDAFGVYTAKLEEEVP